MRNSITPQESEPAVGLLRCPCVSYLLRHVLLLGVLDEDLGAVEVPALHADDLQRTASESSEVPTTTTSMLATS